MELPNDSDMRGTRLPKQLVWAAIVICVLPFLLNLLGMDFGSPKHPFGLSTISRMATHEVADTMHYTLAGSFAHTILEWSAFCTAIFTVILAFIHLDRKKT